uniref:Uncharacterized protein n=1 Tax=Cyprinus carpio TaxID=7962 RepID=A0A8C2CXB9_CYPCA
MNVESQKTVTVSDPSRGITAPMMIPFGNHHKCNECWSSLSFPSLFLPMQVFSVVTIQLLVTFTVVCVFTCSKTVKTVVQGNFWVYLSSYIIFPVVFFFCKLNTFYLSYMVGTVASYHDTSSVVISFTIIIFSSQVCSTHLNLTVCNGILHILSVDVNDLSIFFYSSVLQILYRCLGALLYALFLVVDCQLVMGRQKYSLNPEEYVYAALIIYLDIIMIFLYILLIGGGSKN